MGRAATPTHVPAALTTSSKRLPRGCPLCPWHYDLATYNVGIIPPADFTSQDVESALSLESEARGIAPVAQVEQGAMAACVTSDPPPPP